MKMQLLKITLLVVALLFVGCKKQKKTTNNEESLKINDNPTLVKSFILIDSLNSEFKISKTNFKTTTSQLIDADEDNQPDFEIFFQNSRPYILEPGSYYYAYNIYSVKIETLNNEASILSDSIYYERGNWCGNYLFKLDSIYPKHLLYKDTIKLIDKWRQKQLVILKSDIGKSHYGCNRETYSDKWLVGEIGFIGIKLKNKLGWIKISNADNIGLNYYEYALMK